MSPSKRPELPTPIRRWDRETLLALYVEEWERGTIRVRVPKEHAEWGLPPTKAVLRAIAWAAGNGE